MMINSNAINIYLSKMEEVKRRLDFSEQQLSEYDKTNDLHYLVKKGGVRGQVFNRDTTERGIQNP